MNTDDENTGLFLTAPEIETMAAAQKENASHQSGALQEDQTLKKKEPKNNNTPQRIPARVNHSGLVQGAVINTFLPVWYPELAISIIRDILNWEEPQHYENMLGHHTQTYDINFLIESSCSQKMTLVNLVADDLFACIRHFKEELVAYDEKERLLLQEIYKKEQKYTHYSFSEKTTHQEYAEFLGVEIEKLSQELSKISEPRRDLKLLFQMTLSSYARYLDFLLDLPKRH